jgi:hypothetical protein
LDGGAAADIAFCDELLDRLLGVEQALPSAASV